MGAGKRKSVTDAFHKLYYDSGTMGETWSKTYWMGTRVAKCPLDLWTYQEILSDVKPDIIIECGTLYGGSAAFLASICDLLETGRIITIDVRPREDVPVHPRIRYLHGSSTAPEILEIIADEIGPEDKVLVILDSDHRKEHVLDELRAYADLVTVGSYLIVEDTNLNGHPVAPEFGSGPMEALEDFLKEDDRFQVDENREKFFLTFNPRGYLHKSKA
jgi:cephalosporin hydroxylase